MSSLTGSEGGTRLNFLGRCLLCKVQFMESNTTAEAEPELKGKGQVPGVLGGAGESQSWEHPHIGGATRVTAGDKEERNSLGDRSVGQPSQDWETRHGCCWIWEDTPEPPGYRGCDVHSAK